MQLQSYLINYDVTQSGKVDGMLLYAKTEEDFSLDDDCEEPYERPDGYRFYIRTLDLNQQFQNICAQLDCHINEIKGIRASNNKNKPRNIL
jgi:5-methylcytosine-specific restriction enzyme subunit McrC